MAEIQLYQLCTGCNGSGIRSYNTSPGGPLIEENPCSECGGDGRMAAPFTIESDWFDNISDKVNDVLDKCNDIFEKLNE